MARSCNSQGGAPDLRAAIILSGSTCASVGGEVPQQLAQLQIKIVASPRNHLHAHRLNSHLVRSRTNLVQDLNPRAQVVWRQTASPVIGIRFAVYLASGSLIALFECVPDRVAIESVAGNLLQTRILDGYACRRPRECTNAMASVNRGSYGLKSDATAGAHDEKFRHRPLPFESPSGRANR